MFAEYWRGSNAASARMAMPRCASACAAAPNYLIEYVREDAKTHQRTSYQDAAYSGSTHRELAPHHIEDARNWSPEEMNITAVSALIGRLRKPNAPSSRFSDED